MVLKMAKAVVRVTRHLTPRELATLCVALHQLGEASAPLLGEDVRAVYLADHDLLSDDAIATLITELQNADKVKVTRARRRHRRPA